jgi:hypothetical protein
MPQLTGKPLNIVARIPYVPIEPWEWFQENGLEDKNGGPPPMGEGPKMTPSIYIKDGQQVPGNDATVYGGTVTGDTATDVRIVSYDGAVGGIYAEGPGTDFTVEGAVISLSGDGQGLGEKSAGAGVSDHAKLTLKDCLIDTWGLSRTSTSASGGSVLRVYDSIITSHGAPYGDDCPGEQPAGTPGDSGQQPHPLHRPELLQLFLQLPHHLRRLGRPVHGRLQRVRVSGGQRLQGGLHQVRLRRVCRLGLP